MLQCGPMRDPGQFCQKINKNLYYWFDSDKNLHTSIKSKIKWGNRQELLSIFSIEIEFSTENVTKGGDPR